MRSIIIGALAAAFITTTASAAAPCRDTKGKFIKCPAPASSTKQVCKDEKGKFAKCGTPGAKPVKK